MVRSEHQNEAAARSRITRLSVLHVAQMNLLFPVMVGLAHLFDKPPITFWPSIAICDAACLLAVPLCTSFIRIRQRRERPKR